jgi:hypothetical protein
MHLEEGEKKSLEDRKLFHSQSNKQDKRKIKHIDIG